MDELLVDPEFPYHVGQLTGAAEMAAHWMALQQDGDTQRMGEKLSEAVGWFFKDNKQVRKARTDDATAEWPTEEIRPK